MVKLTEVDGARIHLYIHSYIQIPKNKPKNIFFVIQVSG